MQGTCPLPGFSGAEPLSQYIFFRFFQIFKHGNTGLKQRLPRLMAPGDEDAAAADGFRHFRVVQRIPQENGLPGVNAVVFKNSLARSTLLVA